MLATSENRNAPYQRYISIPVVVLAFPRLEVNATSNRPAIIRMIQFTTYKFYTCKFVRRRLGKIIK
jgi:hypothetical protein